ncbi:MAG: hypothetical protein QNJ81_06240 [Acidimicrobiia bacterium]|nr:hypothetical protein [Acidimicrobiia bacterium]
MSPALYLLTGFPGTGKLTVARAMAAQLEAAGQTVRIVDNHWINNPIFGLIAQDGVTPLPPAVWDRVGEVAAAVVSTVETITPAHWHVIFTAYLDGESDTGTVPRLEAVAAARGSIFVPVRLLCDPAENAKRIVSLERRGLLKSVDPVEPYRLADKGPPYDPQHGNQMDLDITALDPEGAAALILQHTAAVGSR